MVICKIDFSSHTYTHFKSNISHPLRFRFKVLPWNDSLESFPSGVGFLKSINATWKIHANGFIFQMIFFLLSSCWNSNDHNSKVNQFHPWQHYFGSDGKSNFKQIQLPNIEMVMFIFHIKQQTFWWILKIVAACY